MINLCIFFFFIEDASSSAHEQSDRRSCPFYKKIPGRFEIPTGLDLTELPLNKCLILINGLGL